jgi:hypothetical protein
MHDPMTLAFDVRIGKIRIAEIWHQDPESDGSDDSCGWGFPNLTEDELALARSLIHDQYDNLRHWFQEVPDYDAIQRICQIFRIHKAHTRRWWQHPRWHIWHWQIKIVPVFKLKRWLFSRCACCGKRFTWGYSPTSTQWNWTGPRWFHSEPNLYHQECYQHIHRELTEIKRTLGIA